MNKKDLASRKLSSVKLTEALIGLDSPVKTDLSNLRSLDIWQRRKSAGILFPARISTTSPGTKSAAGMELELPWRRTTTWDGSMPEIEATTRLELQSYYKIIRPRTNLPTIEESLKSGDNEQYNTKCKIGDLREGFAQRFPSYTAQYTSNDQESAKATKNIRQ
jgi:hypothetical protein